MHHRRLVLVDLHPRGQQLLEVGVAGEADRHGVGVLVGQEDAHVGARPRPIGDDLPGRCVRYEVRCRDVELPLRRDERLDEEQAQRMVLAGGCAGQAGMEGHGLGPRLGSGVDGAGDVRREYLGSREQLA